MKPEDRLSRLRLDDRWADAEFWRLDVRTEVASKPRRPLMRYGVAAAVLAIVATATATVFAQRWTGAHHRSSTSLAVASEPGIAWKALPPRADDAPEPPTCNANTLSSAAAPPGEVMGALHLKIHVTNNGAACVLPDSQVSLVAGGSVLAQSQGPDKGLLTLGAGETMDYFVGFGAECGIDGAGDVPIEIAVGGGQVPIKGSGVSEELAKCASVNFVPGTSGAEDTRGEYSSLSVKIVAPDVAQGDSIDYSVNVTNGGPTVFTFGTQCPTYRQTATVYGQGEVESSYELNCLDVSQIEPGETVRFEMRSGLPSASGPLKLGWFLGLGPSDVAVLQLK